MFKKNQQGKLSLEHMGWIALILVILVGATAIAYTAVNSKTSGVTSNLNKGTLVCAIGQEVEFVGDENQGQGRLMAGGTAATEETGWIGTNGSGFNYLKADPDSASEYASEVCAPSN